MKKIIEKSVIYAPLFFIALSSNISNASSNIQKNIFRSGCKLYSNTFKDCSFNKIDLGEYNTKKENEFDFYVNYDFNQCNLNYLNATFYSSKNFHKVISGSNKVKLTGYSISLKDPYVWDTRTNEYNSSCNFTIKNIETSLSNFTINQLNGYIKVIDEYKILLKLDNDLKSKFESLHKLINQISVYNVSFHLDAIENDLKQSLNQSDEMIWKAQIEMILFEIEQFKAYNSFHNKEDYTSIRNEITGIIKNLTIDLNTTEINNIIDQNRKKALGILNELSSYPVYNTEQYNKYNNMLNKKD